MSLNIVNQCENKISKYYDKKHVFLVGRATTAIYLALKSLRHKKGEVILPSICCMNPYNAILYAGFKPLFCDINLKNYTLDITYLKSLIAEHDDIRAIIPVHLYGNPCDLDSIKNIVKDTDILLIEDVAQALGGKYNNKKLGSFGDISILSFSSNKNIKANGGGALLTDNDKIAKSIANLFSKLKKEPFYMNFMQTSYRKVYYFFKFLDEHYGINKNVFYSSFPMLFKKMYLFKISDYKAQSISENFESIEIENENRHQKANIYKEELKHDLIDHPVFNKNELSAFWRYSFIYKDNDLGEFSERLRNKGLDVSNWYSALHRIFEPKLNLPNSDYFENHIINLWTNSSKTCELIKNDCYTILNEMEY